MVQETIGRPEMISAITGIPVDELNGGMRWLTVANGPLSGSVKVTPNQMSMVYAATRKFAALQILCPDAVDYYKPALDAIESAYRIDHHIGFVKGLEHLMALMSWE